ncbi:LOW QUALITY PROTEIN: hypothetical protein ACHAWO_006789 [Cyclotella atomus]|uniref:Pyruvate carboxylase n=1 Tax=Cyclotella atomus TaxID=382360 RepID=A0ABD3MYN0_9STRA
MYHFVHCLQRYKKQILCHLMRLVPLRNFWLRTEEKLQRVSYVQGLNWVALLWRCIVMKADQAFELNTDKSPVAAYLDIDYIVKLCVIHGGNGFLSENAQFAQKLEEAGVVFVGPTVDNLNTFGDKTSAKNLAIATQVPVVIGSDDAFATPAEAEAWINDPANPITYPVIVKAAMGGRGRGIRIVPTANDLDETFRLASLLNAFGDGRCFVEKYVEKPRHIEVQCLGDGTGNVIHLYDRDCSVQRRHQKIIETRQNIFNDAVRLLKANNYRCVTGPIILVITISPLYTYLSFSNAGTVEFLVDKDGNHFFVEVNPRVQVEHTITEEITGIDIVQSQIMIASRKTLDGIGLTQDSIKEPTSYPMQCRVTTENPSLDFRPDTGTINVFRMPCGFGIRLDDGPGFQGAKITPHYDSLLVKITAKARNRKDAARKLKDGEFRVRGVQTNKSFLLNVLQHHEFLEGEVTTGFIADNPALMAPLNESDRAQKLLHYIGESTCNQIVDGTPKSLGAAGDPPSSVDPIVPELHNEHRDVKQSLKKIFDQQGPEAFAKAVRENEGLLVTDDIPFQMLLRGANAVGYTSYPDNVVFEFCKLAKEAGMDVFRVFDSLNYIENMRLGIDAVGEAGGIVEAAVCYTGDVTDPKKGLYDLEYYLNFTRKLEACGIHVLAIKDMAGLLKPNAARMLIGSIRDEFPNLPIHVHTHDTAGTGVASMLAAAEAGADAVDAATDALSGTTAQPSLGALVASTKGTKLDTGLDLKQISTLNEYWEECRGLYAPFESGQKSGSADVYIHEMPGGQYTNLLYQSSQLGLTGQWSQVKAAYAAANRLLSDIIKVTPSSKVTGDLDQKAEELSFPNSVIEISPRLSSSSCLSLLFLASHPQLCMIPGYLGIPPFGFPEPLRSRVLKGRTIEGSGGLTPHCSLPLKCFQGRPGAQMDPYDFGASRTKLEEK